MASVAAWSSEKVFLLNLGARMEDSDSKALNSILWKRFAISALSEVKRDTTTGCLKHPDLRWFALTLCRPRAKRMILEAVT